MSACIAIVEDDPVVQAHLTAILAADARFTLAGMAATVAAGRALIASAPDLFLLDIGLPDGSGYDLIPLIKAACTARVLIFTTFGDRDTVVAALDAGADGYLLKDSAPATIVEGIAVTLAGGAPISPLAATYLLDRLRARAPEAASDDRLTPRETDLLREFARGASYKEAARALDISPLTVGNHVKAIYRKLAVNSRAEALRVSGHAQR